MRQIWMLILWISVAFFLWKCGWLQGREMQNVEERDCATVMMVNRKDKQYQLLIGVARERKVGEQSLVERFSKWEVEDTRQLCQKYALTTGKTLSLAHLKIIILSENGMKDAVVMLGQDQEIAQTCPVVIASGEGFEEKFEEYGKKAEYPVGIYLQNVMKRTEREGGSIPWLLDYRKWLQQDGTVNPCRIQKTEHGYEIEE